MMDSTASNSDMPPRQTRCAWTKWMGAAASVIFAIGFIVWPGCATPPLPSSRTPVAALKRADMAFAKRAHPTQSEVFSKLGKPDEYFADLRVACYKLNHVSRRRLVLLLGVLPIGVPKDNPGLEVAMFQFDEHGQMLRRAIRMVREPFYLMGVHQPNPSASEMNDNVREWVNGNSRKN